MILCSILTTYSNIVTYTCTNTDREVMTIPILFTQKTHCRGQSHPSSLRTWTAKCLHGRWCSKTCCEDDLILVDLGNFDYFCKWFGWFRYGRDWTWSKLGNHSNHYMWLSWEKQFAEGLIDFPLQIGTVFFERLSILDFEISCEHRYFWTTNDM